MGIEISIRDPRDADMTAILQSHVDFCSSSTPIEFCYVLDVSELTTPDITVFGANLNGVLVGVGALRILDKDHAELKSMHTVAKARGNGVGRALVEHISSFAREKGISRLSLETGTNDDFKPARDLYVSLGFAQCDYFGEYENTEQNVCMTKYL